MWVKAAPSALICGFGLLARRTRCALPLGARPASSTGLSGPARACLLGDGTRAVLPGSEPAPLARTAPGLTCRLAQEVCQQASAPSAPSSSVILSPKCHTGKEASSEGVGVSLLPQWKLTLRFVFGIFLQGILFHISGLRPLLSRLVCLQSVTLNASPFQRRSRFPSSVPVSYPRPLTVENAS